jgi:pyruvate dehydrogenase E2 component (dihydrolipoamide acetyltransferase)
MPFEFKFPDVGEGILEGEIVKWLVKEGDIVKEDQNIAQIETDKAVADIPSPKSGTVLKINYKEGETIKVGETLCIIGEKGEKVSKSPPKKAVKEDKKTITEKKVEKEETKQVPRSETMIGLQETGKVFASPAVRKAASELKIELSNVKGSGESGRVLMKDIKSAADISEVTGMTAKAEKLPQQTITVKKKYDEYGYLERVPLKGIRKVIAKNMVTSLQGSAQLTSMDDFDVTKLWDLKRKEKKSFEKKGLKLTFLPFIIKAVVAALKENPILNSSLVEEEILIKKYYNIGIAVETEVGLMVPVIKIAEDKNVEKLAKEIVDLAEKARTRKIDIMDMKGGTFTITNYGSIGGTYATPILNPGEAAILGLGRIFDKTYTNKVGLVQNKKVLPISLTFDHRILDGAQAARFIESLKKILEDPSHMVMVLR